MNDTYTRDEVDKAGDCFPEKGTFCPKCKTYIPKFEDLTEEKESIVKDIMGRRGKAAAMSELRKLTGCSARWAKIWVVHPNGPTPLHQGPPCPFCGGALRTERAKQRPHCFKTWHNEKL